MRRTDGFAHCPDIVLNSTYWHEWDEVAAFEELVGSHGGLGGSQSHPFLLHPVSLALPEQELVGAEAVHRELRRWLVQLGHSEYGEPRGRTGRARRHTRRGRRRRPALVAAHRARAHARLVRS